MFIGERCAFDECHREDSYHSNAATVDNTIARITSDHKRIDARTITSLLLTTRTSVLSATSLHRAGSETRIPTLPWTDISPVNVPCSTATATSKPTPHIIFSTTQADEQGQEGQRVLVRQVLQDHGGADSMSAVLASFCPSHRAPNQHSCKHTSSNSSPASSSTRLARMPRQAAASECIPEPQDQQHIRSISKPAPTARVNPQARHPDTSSSSATSAPFSRCLTSLKSGCPSQSLARLDRCSSAPEQSAAHLSSIGTPFLKHHACVVGK